METINIDLLSGVKRAIARRILLGEDGGGFVEHVATREWERALWCANGFNSEHFTEIMKWRLTTLPQGCIKLGEKSTYFMIDAYKEYLDD